MNFSGQKPSQFILKNSFYAALFVEVKVRWEDFCIGKMS